MDDDDDEDDEKKDRDRGLYVVNAGKFGTETGTNAMISFAFINHPTNIIMVVASVIIILFIIDYLFLKLPSLRSMG